MFSKPSAETFAALASLGRTRDWKLVEQWLLAERELCIKRSFNADIHQARQAQGQLMVIDELIRQTRAAVESATRR